MVMAKKSRYYCSVSMVESVGWFRVGTVDLYVWKSWLNRLDGTVKVKNRGIVVWLVWLNFLNFFMLKKGH